MRALVTGWFTFEHMGATAGDIHARELTQAWLARAGIPCDVALAPPFEGGVDWSLVDPTPYTHLVFVCGPFGENVETRALMKRFAHCKKVGLNLSMLQALDEYDPFDALLERDSERTTRADISFAAPAPSVPVVGVCLVKPQEEYGRRARHEEADEAIHDLLERHEAARVPIDTRLDENAGGLRTPGEIEALVAHMDVLLTTRLHGTVFALKNGVPVIAVDPILGGAKVSKQAELVGWPHVFDVRRLDPEALDEAFAFCLTDEARDLARACGARAANMVAETEENFVRALTQRLAVGG